MSQHPIEGLMDVTLEKIKSMVDSNTIIGNPINMADGTLVLPISKVTFGFASGGADFPSKTTKDLFGGGGGAGVSIQPVAFLVVKDGSVRMLQLADTSNSVDRAIGMLPDMVDKITALFNKQGDAKLAALAERGLVLYFTGFFAAGINIVCAAFAAACARVRESFVISILRGAVLIVPAVLFLPEIAGTDGIWLSFPAAEALTLLFSVLFLVSFFRKFAKSAKSS